MKPTRNTFLSHQGQEREPYVGKYDLYGQGRDHDVTRQNIVMLFACKFENNDVNITIAT